MQQISEKSNHFLKIYVKDMNTNLCFYLLGLNSAFEQENKQAHWWLLWIISQQEKWSEMKCLQMLEKALADIFQPCSSCSSHVLPIFGYFRLNSSLLFNFINLDFLLLFVEWLIGLKKIVSIWFFEDPDKSVWRMCESKIAGSYERCRKL